MKKRQSERVTALGSITCSVAGTVSRDELCDLSIHGCKLRHDDSDLAKGTKLDLTLVGDINVSGIVRWAIGSHAGIEFREELSEVAVRYFAAATGAVVAEDATFDGFGRRLPPLCRIEKDGSIAA